MGTAPSVALYEAPTVALDATGRDVTMAWIIYVVLIIAILVLGGVALFCISKGKNLVWAQAGWTHWTIACN